MTRLTLSETCMLEASGELGESTRQRLMAHLEKHPEARQHLEQIKGQLELLRSMPKLELSDEMRKQLASSIKQGVQKKLRMMEREELARRRWKLIYRSLAGVSAAAAAVIVVAGLFVINQSIAQRREQERIAAVSRAVNDIALADRTTDVDDQLADVNDSIREYQDRSSQGAVQDKDMHNLLTVLATVSDGDEIMPPPEPGSL